MLPLIIAPQPILKTKAAEIKLPPNLVIKKLSADMFEAMKHYNGIGLAAPQVNVSERLIVIATPENPTAYINPEIVKSSWKKVAMEEGCLSLPGVFGIVKRPARILARYFDLAGKPHEEWLDAMVARIYQHEVDHLNGILFIERQPKIIMGEELLKKYR